MYEMMALQWDPKSPVYQKGPWSFIVLPQVWSSKKFRFIESPLNDPKVDLPLTRLQETNSQKSRNICGVIG